MSPPPPSTPQEEIPGESRLSWLMQLICIGVVLCLFVLIWVTHLARSA